MITAERANQVRLMAELLRLRNEIMDLQGDSRMRGQPSNVTGPVARAVEGIDAAFNQVYSVVANEGIPF